MPAERSRPVELLMQEHRLIEAVLDALSEVAGELERDEPPPPTELESFVDWLRRYADAFHHGKEEDVLFTAMVACGMPGDAGPIAVMLEQHDEGRRLVTRLADAASSAAWSADTRRRAACTATDFAALLHQHIQIEDNVLYPMALATIPPAGWETIEREFDKLAASHAAERATLEALAATLIARSQPTGFEPRSLT
ncbi:MAG TPA: hemerythrin domain-containing protein [Kofleriaceae bacterium]|nr:hemerythrin domain-containing protein [Kofleriaceae bacterium]